METRNRKPRCDSPLNCLSDDRQAALMDFMRTHTLDKTVEHLAAEGLKTNSSSLCIFRAAYNTRAGAGEANGAVAGLASSERPPLTGADLFERAQENYMARAILNNDDKAWCRLQRARQQQERLQQNVEWRKLEERRVKLLEQRAEQSAKPVHEVKQRMTPEERDAEFREIFGVSKDYILPGGVEYPNPQTPVPQDPQDETQNSHAAAESTQVSPTPAACDPDTQHDLSTIGLAKVEIRNNGTSAPTTDQEQLTTDEAQGFKPEESMSVAELMANPVRGNKSLRLIGNRLEYFSLINEFPPRFIYEGEITPHLIRISLHYLALA